MNEQKVNGFTFLGYNLYWYKMALSYRITHMDTAQRSREHRHDLRKM